MRFKSISIFAGMMLLLSLFASASAAGRLNTDPQQVTFVNAQGINLKGWLFKPEGQGPYPAVVLMPGCMGAYTSGDAQEIDSTYLEWSERLVDAGYVALLVDSFTPRNALKNQCGNGTTGISEVSDRPQDAYAGLNYLASQAFVAAGRIGLMGWSHGASAVMAAMDESRFKNDSSFQAAVAFYPGCGLGNAFGGVQKSSWKPYAPFVILHGSADTVADPTTCTNRVATAGQLGTASVTINIFENAQHRFDGASNVANAFTQHDVDAKIAADVQALRFFDMHLP